jgi:hypothetical protein
MSATLTKNNNSVIRLDIESRIRKPPPYSKPPCGEKTKKETTPLAHRRLYLLSFRCTVKSDVRHLCIDSHYSHYKKDIMFLNIYDEARLKLQWGSALAFRPAFRLRFAFNFFYGNLMFLFVLYCYELQNRSPDDGCMAHPSYPCCIHNVFYGSLVKKCSGVLLRKRKGPVQLVLLVAGRSSCTFFSVPSVFRFCLSLLLVNLFVGN